MHLKSVEHPDLVRREIKNEDKLIFNIFLNKYIRIKRV